ncbi:MAG: host specificity protein [Gemmatimonadetes bacterium]|nr:host specificity protein [Gemmatimonadota bacterium]
MRNLHLLCLAVLIAGACGGSEGPGDDAETDDAAAEAPGAEALGVDQRAGTIQAQRATLVGLWSNGTPAFGVFVPSERERGARGPDGERLPPLYTAEGAARLAANPLLDYLFLNLEGSYDPEAVATVAAGLGEDPDAPTLLVRIPPISADGATAARDRAMEALQAGADGIVFPHVRSAAEARQVVESMEWAGADVWSPSNPGGTVLAMVMIEDPGALEDAAAIADVEGYSVLACGIGSLSQALGSREAGEAGNQRVLEEAKRVGRPDMITANAEDVAQRIDEGFLGLLMSGPEADEAIRVGRAAAGR